MFAFLDANSWDNLVLEMVFADSICELAVEPIEEDLLNVADLSTGGGDLFFSSFIDDRLED